MFTRGDRNKYVCVRNSNEVSNIKHLEKLTPLNACCTCIHVNIYKSQNMKLWLLILGRLYLSYTLFWGRIVFVSLFLMEVSVIDKKKEKKSQNVKSTHQKQNEMIKLCWYMLSKKTLSWYIDLSS